MVPTSNTGGKLTEIRKVVVTLDTSTSEWVSLICTVIVYVPEYVFRFGYPVKLRLDWWYVSQTAAGLIELVNVSVSDSGSADTDDTN